MFSINILENWSSRLPALSRITFFSVLSLLSIGGVSAQINLQITEIHSGQSGTKLTADWFEITNEGDVAWVATLDDAIYYDDESSDPADAVAVSGIVDIQPGESVVVIISDDVNDVVNFTNVWSPVANLTNVEVGITDGKGLGAGGDAVTIWLGDPSSTPADYEAYPDTELNDGQTYDIQLAAFSTVGNDNDAVVTLAMGGDASNVPNIGSPGNTGAAVIDVNAPAIAVGSSEVLLRLNESSAYIAAAINDPTDPAAVDGISFVLSDNDTPIEGLTITASSDNQDVLADANLNLSGSGTARNLKISPSDVGYAIITITVTDTDLKTATYTIGYAVSASALEPVTSRFHMGTSDGSTAITTGDNYMWVADDENQVLRLYDRNNSGMPIKEIDMNSDLGVDDEIDLEGSYRNGNTIYWMGSHTETERSFLFSVTETGAGLTSELTYNGKYSSLRTDLIAWDENDGHGLGASFLNLANTLEIEGLAKDPNNEGGALIALRGPLVEGKALIIPVTNFENLIEASSGSAVFGDVMMVDLGKRSFRSIDCNNNGCLITGGPVGNIDDFKLYTWSGNSNDSPELRSADLMAMNSFGSYEGIVGLPSTPFTGANGDDIEVQLLVDMGTANFYNDGSEAKDLPHGEWRKFKSERTVLGPIEIPPVALLGDVVITEVMQNPSAVGDDLGEWFELYNNTNSAIDINGWSISDKDRDIHTIDNGGELIIPAMSYIVLGNNANASVNGGVNLAYTYSDFALANGSDELILKASDGNVVDSISWDNGVTFPDPNGASMSLQNVNADNSEGSNWCESGEAVFGAGDYGTPGMANDCPLPPMANLQITEIWCGNADGDNLTADWFEITNFGDVAWTAGLGTDLYYDDESQAPADADPINGITEILPGQSVIVIVSNEADVEIFKTIWSPDYNIENVQIGWADGAGLGQGGDGVTLFMGTPAVENIVDFESYPPIPNGASYDIMAAQISEPGAGIIAIGTNIAIATTANNGVESAIGSPGNKGPLVMPEFDLQITEIYSGQSGDKLTVDWFEVVNQGTASWVAGVDGSLYYDDDSSDPADAMMINGISSVAPGESVVVLITDAETEALDQFKMVWGEVIDLSTLQIGYMDGKGLGGGGDSVTLWVGDPATTTPVDKEGYLDTELNDGQTYDVSLAAFSTVGNENNAVVTIALGGDLADVPNVGSPGNGLAVPPFKNLMISEIYSGQSGDKLTADWFEIKNTSDADLMLTSDNELYYDDESGSAADASRIDGIAEIGAGEYAIVILGNSDDVSEFTTVWGDVVDLTNVAIGFTDGAGLGGGGDAVTVWLGSPEKYVPVDMASYPDTELNDGQTYDVELDAFSTVGNASNAVVTIALGGAGDVPNIGSPGNVMKVTAINSNADAEFVIYPNPSSGVYQISSTTKLIAAEVYDLTGQLLLTISLNNEKYELDLTALPNAMFVVQLISEEGIETVRLIKR